MDSTEAEVATHGEGSKDTVPSTSNVSDQGQHGPKLNKASLKRKSGTASNHKAKKHKKARVKRSARPSYTVHEGEDMLLVISSSASQYGDSTWAPKKKGSKKKKLSKGKGKTVQIKKKKIVRAKPKLANNTNKDAKVVKEEEDTSLFVPEKATDNRWGQSLPEEVLINIFQLVVIQDGAVPFLCRVGRVCRLWNIAASSPVLWRKVTVGHCWIAPGKTQLPKTEEKIKNTFNWLAQNRSVR